MVKNGWRVNYLITGLSDPWTRVPGTGTITDGADEKIDKTIVKTARNARRTLGVLVQI